MSSVRLSAHAFARRRPPHRIIIAHGEHVRSFTIRPWLAAAVAGIVLLFGALYLAATGYLVFRDDLLAASIARQTRMQHAYEDRIAALRSDIDRLTSRQLLNQEAVEAEVERLLGRQAALDARQDVIANLSQAIRRAGIGADEVSLDVQDTPAPAARQQPAGIGGPSAFFAPQDEPLRAIAAVDPLRSWRCAPSNLARRAGPPAGRLRRCGRRRRQRPYQEDREDPEGARPPAAAEPASGGDGIGGPFVPIDEDADPRPSARAWNWSPARSSASRRSAACRPVAAGQAHPERHHQQFRDAHGPVPRRARHAYGDRLPGADRLPARATAGGTVVVAEFSGGYGNMVEIDHGNGLATRFGHLSRIDVVPGQVVSKGTVIGQSGSTGRSTGPHLHYEIRLDGAAIDPMRYIKAGSEIAPLL